MYVLCASRVKRAANWPETTRKHTIYAASKPRFQPELPSHVFCDSQSSTRSEVADLLCFCFADSHSQLDVASVAWLQCDWPAAATLSLLTVCFHVVCTSFSCRDEKFFSLCNIDFGTIVEKRSRILVTFRRGLRLALCRDTNSVSQTSPAATWTQRRGMIMAITTRFGSTVRMAGAC